MTGEDFLAEILANPDDDTPRLIYADFLEERGDPRAEFIRVQCELANLTSPATELRMYHGYSPYSAPEKMVRAQSDLPRFRELLARQLALSRTHGATWVQPFGSKMTGVIFARGFVEGCSIRAIDFARLATEWYRHTPLRQLHVKHFGEYLGDMLQSKLLLHVNTLVFNPTGRRLHDHEARLLAACPNLANVRHLHLGYNEVSEAGLQALLESPHLNNLRALCGVRHDVAAPLRAALQARFGQV